MADWSASYSFGGPNWAGQPPLATIAQLNSSIGIISTVCNVLSTNSATNFSTLQGEIAALVLSTGGSTASWATFPALVNVNINSKNINNAATVTATSFSGPLTGNVTGNLTGNSAGTHTGAVVGNVSGNVSGNLTGNVTGNISNASLTVLGQYSITETADVGSAVSNYASYGTVNITGKGGLGGIVNVIADVATPLNPAVTVSQLTMEAKGNYGLITPGTPVGYIPRGGLVSITARQGLTPTPPAEVTSALFANGEIDLTAYSYGTVAGVIKLSAGANMIYAGPATPYFGLYGQNTIYGLTANSMIAGTPPTLPTLVGTNFLYGALGVGGYSFQIVGNKILGGLGVDFLQPYPNSDLYIQSNANGTDTIIMSGIKSLAMSNGGNITGVGNLNVTTINSAAYPPVGNQTFSNISTNSISSGQINTSSINVDNFSTGSAFISSINGQPISVFINSGDVSFNSVSTNFISTNRLFLASMNDSITVTSSNICNVGQFRANNGLFDNAINVTNNASVGSLTSGGAISGTSGSFSGNVGANNLTATFAVNGATAVFSGTVQGGTLYTPSNALVGSLTVTNAAGVGSLTVTGAAGVGSLSITGTTTAATVNATSISNAGLLTSDSISTNTISSGTAFIGTISSLTISTGSAFISSINGVDINAFGGSTSIPSFLSTNEISSGTAFIGTISSSTMSTGSAFISSINGVNIITLLNPTPVTFSTISTFSTLITSSFTAEVGSFDVITLSSLYGGHLVGDFIDVSGARVSFKNCNSDSSDPAGVQIYTSNDNYYVTATTPSPTEFSSYTAMTSWTNQASNFVTNPTYFPPLPVGAVNITANGQNYFIGGIATEYDGRVFNTNNSGFYQITTIKAGEPYITLPHGSYSFWTSNSAGFVVNFQNAAGDALNDPIYVETNEYVMINYYNLNNASLFSYTITNAIPAVAFTSTNTTSITNLIMDNFDTILTTSNTYQISNVQTGFAGNLAMNYSTIAFGPSTVRGATIPYTFAGTVQAPQVSSMNVNLSSINGYPFSEIVNSGYTYSTFTNIFLTPANGFALNMSTGAIGTSFATICNVSANILKATMSFTTTDQAFIPFTPPQMNIGPSNIDIWASTIVSITQAQVGTVSNVISLDLLGGKTGQVDTCNTSGCNAFIKGGILGFLPNNSYRRFTFNGSFWTQNFSPTPQNATYDTTLNIYQKFDGAYINTGDYLYLSTGGVQVDGDFYADNVYPANLQVTGPAQFNYLSTTTLAADTITAVNEFANVITAPTINVSNLSSTTINGRPKEGQVGINQLLTYSTIGTRINYVDANTNHFDSFPWVSSLSNTTALQGQITYPTYPGGFFLLAPQHSGSNFYTLNANGTLTTTSNAPLSTWISSQMRTHFASFPTSDQVSPANMKGEFKLVNIATTGLQSYFLQTGVGNYQINMNPGEIHTWTNTNTGVGWTCNLASALYPTTNYTDTISLVQKPGGIMSLNAQYIAFSDLTIVTYSQRIEGTLESDPSGTTAVATVNNIQVNYLGKTFSTNDYVCTITINHYGAGQASLATNEVAVSAFDSGGIWFYKLRLTTATITGVNKKAFWSVQVTLTPRPLATGTHTQANFDELPSTGFAFYPEIGISSIFTSTLTVQAIENISLLANIAPPAYISSGNITIAGSGSVEMIGQQAVIGGLTDVDIEAVNRDVIITAASTISLFGYNTLLSNAGDIDLYGGSNKRVRLYANNINIEDGTGNIINFGSNVYDSFTNIGDQRVKYGTVSGSNIMDITNLTGDINLTASNINLTGVTNINGNLDMCNNDIKTVGTFSRMLSATSVDQPILQFGEDSSGSGASGSVVINLPVSYTSASSYVAFATMEDSDPAEMSVVRVSATSIEIYWAQGGSGSHIIAWNTMGI